jgi:hypothetical protein
MFRHTIRFGLAALATLAATLAPAAMAQAKQSCTPKNSRTLASDSYARVYGKSGKAYVCIKSNGRTTLLANASPNGDQFALGGKWVGWSSSDRSDPSIPLHSIITVMRISDHFINDRWYPGQLNERIDKIVVLSDGAAAWAMTPPPGSDAAFTAVQGTDRAGHPADQFSDDHTNVVASSLHVISGKTIGWSYDDGTHGKQKLY